MSDRPQDHIAEWQPKCITPGKDHMTQRTKQNLNSAMQSEAFTQAAYLRYAAHARLEEDWELAQAFQKIADADRARFFAQEADLVRLGANTGENLRTAINDQVGQIAMYSHFAQQATEDGDSRAARLFEEVRHEKERQRTELEAALEKLGYSGTVQTVEA
ncbi:MAG: rubrerythrin family protein [Acidobacteriaceae bacterium]|nr:rubrerythrin family protein [Acidobacteriaceae bacterium]MBV9308251.1 rubrerythrin family protein [Acidobacteriaceae bacterium]MBV9675228.1 rubrerythrin family protein [Acidobacteriaceae bacterium]MBV9939685.1 rubrerythrin family protein [Acidobacteriaceae bacterium]